jgi:hypothetical protein
VPKYHPLEQPLAIKTSLSDLIALTWQDRGIAADFIVPGDDERVLRVHFDKTHIIRILDETERVNDSETVAFCI